MSSSSRIITSAFIYESDMASESTHKTEYIGVYSGLIRQVFKAVIE